MSGPDFNTIASKLGRLEQYTSQGPKDILCLDPGETTGWAFFRVDGLGVRLRASGQIDTPDIIKGIKQLSIIWRKYTPDILVVEDYRVYGWKVDQHAWANLHTPKYIGAIFALAYLNGRITPVMQMAQFAKEFCTDDKLKRWGFYKKGQPHGRDAIRHGCAYILFHNEK